MAHAIRMTGMPAPSVIAFGPVQTYYAVWPTPTCIISDGPSGAGKLPGEPRSVQELGEWYAPHVAAWSSASRPNTTLWFWNSELGWASVHPLIEAHGWQYEECCIWDKGPVSSGTRTVRGVPVVTEVAVRYTRRFTLPTLSGVDLPLKDWLRSEWRRSGLPLYRANEACGVANAASRKYLSGSARWYFPPGEAVERMAAYCLRHGRPSEWPYFSPDGNTPLRSRDWNDLRAKWNPVPGATNVWHEPPVHGAERVREGNLSSYAGQKPLSLMARQILHATDIGDVVWEPFGGLSSGAIAASLHDRRGFSAEINGMFYLAAIERSRLLESSPAEAA